MGPQETELEEERCQAYKCPPTFEKKKRKISILLVISIAFPIFPESSPPLRDRVSFLYEESVFTFLAELFSQDTTLSYILKLGHRIPPY